jgi:hypothetical protein
MTRQEFQRLEEQATERRYAEIATKAARMVRDGLASPEQANAWAAEQQDRVVHFGPWS